MTSWERKTINLISGLPGRNICGQTQMTGLSGEMNEIICPGESRRSEKKIQYYLLAVMSMNQGQTLKGNIHKAEIVLLLHLF